MKIQDQSTKIALSLTEDSNLECKQILFCKDHPVGPKECKLRNTIIAFANEEGGTLLCGVKDNGEVQSMTRGQLKNLISMITNISSDTIKPRITTHASIQSVLCIKIPFRSWVVAPLPSLSATPFPPLITISFSPQVKISFSPQIAAYFYLQIAMFYLRIVMSLFSLIKALFPSWIKTHNILRVKIPKGGFAHTDRKGRAYRRHGDQVQKMTERELRCLAQDRGHMPVLEFDEKPMPETNFGTLDETLWRPLLSRVGEQDPERELQNLRLLAEDEHDMMRATAAGILICSNKPVQWLPNARIDAVRYQGNDLKLDPLDSETFYGPVNLQIEGALSFARRNMQMAARKKPTRIDMPQYSEKALFEAVVNAVAHRDYSIEGNENCIRFLMFEDRIEISSPGGLPGDLTIAGISKRQLTRNRYLVSMLEKMRTGNTAGAEGRQSFMEQRGAGVTIIRQETEQLGGKLGYRLIGGSELHLIISAASVEVTPSTSQWF